jgi:hypothetical protein
VTDGFELGVAIESPDGDARSDPATAVGAQAFAAAFPPSASATDLGCFSSHAAGVSGVVACVPAPAARGVDADGFGVGLFFFKDRMNTLVPELDDDDDREVGVDNAAVGVDAVCGIDGADGPACVVMAAASDGKRKRPPPAAAAVDATGDGTIRKSFGAALEPPGAASTHDAEAGEKGSFIAF